MRRDSFRSGLQGARLVVIGLAALALWWLGGCGESSTTPPPRPPVSTLTGVEDGVVAWTVDVPTRGTVRYGFASGQYDRIAYPPVAGGKHEAFATTHAVPLLTAADGAVVYFQRVDEKEDGTLFSAAEETATVAVDAKAPLLRFTTLDVQFGDSHVLRLPSEDRVVMIDAGNPSEGRGGQSAPEHVMSWLDEQGVTRLDVALTTHVHYDHYGGFLRSGGTRAGGVLDNYEVGVFLDVPAVSGNADRRADLQERCDDLGIPRPVIAHGMTSATDPELLGWDPLVTVAVLNAGSQPDWLGSYGDINNDSVVLRIGYGAVDLITGGDCEVPCENFVIANHAAALAGVEYFKAFHHGRNDENSANWLGRVEPRATVIPIAFAAYNEGWQGGYDATAAVLRRLAAMGSDVFRFDDAEPIRESPDRTTFWHTTLVTDGASFEVRVEPSIW